MSIDPQATREDDPSPRLFSLGEASRLFYPPPHPHPASLIRQATHGIKLRDGSRLKLRLTRLPGRWVVSEQAIREFVAALTADRTGEPTTIAAAPSPARARRLDRVDAELDRIGI